MLPHQYNPETDPQEAARAAGMMIRTGTVAAVDLAARRVRFTSGGITTDWLPWLERRAGGGAGGRTWWPPVQGEQGLMLAPGGDLARAVILPGMFSDAMPAGSDQPATERTDWDAQDFWQWQQGRLHVACTHQVLLQVGESSITIEPGRIHMQAGGASLTMAGGIVTASADVVASGISLTKHKHGEVSKGSDKTGRPQ